MSELHSLFPINLTANWQSKPVQQLSPLLFDWLNDPNSLTARLKTNCETFRVEVLGQQIESCSLKESNTVINEGDRVLVREVLLYCDEIPQVYARSLLPLSSLTGEEEELARLGNRPLGQMLFKNPNLQRKNLKISSFEQSPSLSGLLNILKLDDSGLLWGRRSLFYLNNKAFSVAEIFLPGAFAYAQAQDDTSTICNP